jgi:hypothetical protein
MASCPCGVDSFPVSTKLVHIILIDK